MRRFVYLFLLPLAVLLGSCHKDDPNNPDEPQHCGRTVLVYMAMQNSLGAANYHKGDSAEMVNAMSYIPKDDRVLLFIDDAELPRLYELSSQQAGHGPRLVKRWRTEVSSASAAMLTEVLQLMRQQYPSDSYGLIMGSHASGWLPRESYNPQRSVARVAPGGASNGEALRLTKNGERSATSGPRKTWGIDVGPDGSMGNDAGVAGSVPDEMEITDLASAIESSGVHLTFLLFDACLMQNIEVAYALRRATDYIIASPISISAEGAYYTDLVHYGLFTADPVDVARTYVSYYKNEGSVKYTDGYGTVISCVRTAGLEAFAQTMKGLLTEVVSPYLASLGTTDWVEALKPADMSAALNYQAYSSRFFFRPHNYDLISAMQTLGANASQMATLRQALSDVVVYSGATASFWIGPGFWTMKTMPTDAEAWCGLSMFVPQQTYTEYAPECRFGDLNKAFRQTEWGRAVFSN